MTLSFSCEVLRSCESVARNRSLQAASFSQMKTERRN
jgi:hypothetical protein